MDQFDLNSIIYCHLAMIFTSIRIPRSTCFALCGAAGVPPASRPAETPVPQRSRPQERVRASPVRGAAAAAGARVPLAPQRAAGGSRGARDAAGGVPRLAAHQRLDARCARVERPRARRRLALRSRAQLRRTQATKADQRYVRRCCCYC